MVKIPEGKPPISAGLRATQGIEDSHIPTLAQAKDDIGAHIWGFVDVEESRKQGKPVVTSRSTTEMLNAMGIKTKAGGFILTAPFAAAQGHGISHLELDRIKEGIRGKEKGITADTGAYNKKTGNLDPDKAVAFWKDLCGPKGYATAEDVQKFVTGDTIAKALGVTIRKPGKVLNELEIRLLFDLAGQVDNKGQKVLTADRYVAFLDGTLWQDIAAARLSGTLYQPRAVGEMVHEGPKKVAVGLAKLAASFGGFHADPGTSAAAQAHLTIDDQASLAEQQAWKTLGPTIGGAMKALCPVGFG